MKQRERELARFFCRFISEQSTGFAYDRAEHEQASQNLINGLGEHIKKQDEYINRIVKQIQQVCDEHDITFVIDGNRPFIDLDSYGYQGQ
tara:strand:- start:9547 stop:9816 length:270 start_codon:yes stop_codon:yes gene_type:complete